MHKQITLMGFFVFFGLLVSFSFSPSYATLNFDSGDDAWTKVKKSTGVIMKFCQNETFEMSECDERYENYGWTDRINVLIYAPGWNEDPFKIEEIGTTSNQIRVITDADSRGEIEMTETGPNTGVFFGPIKLAGKQNFVMHNQNGVTVKPMGMTHDGRMTMTMQNMQMVMGEVDEYSNYYKALMIKTNPQDGRVTVSWEANEDTIIQKSATYTFREGEVHFDKQVFDVTEPVTFYMRDADLWKHHQEFFTYYTRVYSDSDPAGIYVGVQFQPNHSHTKAKYGGEEIVHLNEPAASSRTKYTPDGKWKTYLWWEPGGVLGVNQDYNLNLMVHDGKTDKHETGLSYDMQIYLDGKLVETRTDRYYVDGQGIEPINFTQRGSVKIVLSNIFDGGESVNFTFQVAPEAVVEQVVPKHPSYERGTEPAEFVGYEHGHYIDYLPGKFFMTTDDSSQSQNKLRVSDGDTIYVEYEDLTLPKPYSEHHKKDIVARALVLDTGVKIGSNSESVFIETPRVSITPSSLD